MQTLFAQIQANLKPNSVKEFLAGMHTAEHILAWEWAEGTYPDKQTQIVSD